MLLLSHRVNPETPEKTGNPETKEQRWVASLLLACPFYDHVHRQWARFAYCDCCITYLIHFQGETGKQGPVGPAGPPGIIVRHSIFNVFGFLYSFSISISNCTNLTSFLVHFGSWQPKRCCSKILKDYCTSAHARNWALLPPAALQQRFLQSCQVN